MYLIRSGVYCLMLKDKNVETQNIDLKLGSWVLHSATGVEWEDEGVYSFDTKSEALDFVASKYLDYTPRANRVSKGLYMYTPVDLDTGETIKEYFIEKITVDNKVKYESMVSDMLNKNPYLI